MGVLAETESFRGSEGAEEGDTWSRHGCSLVGLDCDSFSSQRWLSPPSDWMLMRLEDKLLVSYLKI